MNYIYKLLFLLYIYCPFFVYNNQHNILVFLMSNEKYLLKSQCRQLLMLKSTFSMIEFPCGISE